MTSPNRPRFAPKPPAAALKRPAAPPPKRPAPQKQDGPNYSTSTTTGVEPSVAAVLSYSLGVVTGVLFLVLEKENRYVRFHAAQSIVLTMMLVVVGVGVSMASQLLVYLPFFGRLGVFLLTTGLALVTFVLWLALMWRALQGENWEFPVAGELAKKMV